MEKIEYHKMIAKRLKLIMDARKMNQQNVLAKCINNGYEISQPALSKILSGTNIQIFQIAQIARALDIDLSELLSLDTETEITVNKKESDSNTEFITDARNKAFRGYKGEYHIYFYTTKNEDYIHNGIFKLVENPYDHSCVVDLSFKTGELDAEGNEISKFYTGPAYYSISMQTIYAELTSEEIGEKSYLLFHYDFLAYKNLECRLAMAVTVSSGTQRLPTAHRMLLTRKELSSEEKAYLCGQLKFNSSEILISENAYREFLRDPALPKRFFEYFGDAEKNAERFISNVAKVDYYSFNESMISDSFLPKMDKIKIICLLRKYSAAARYNKISDKAEEIIFKYLELNNQVKVDDFANAKDEKDKSNHN